MINSELELMIRRVFSFSMTSGQDIAVKEVVSFLFDTSKNAAFLLRGYAGTGKTFMASAVVSAWVGTGRKVVLLAPTGRAAKVFSGVTGMAAYTIHKKIYRQKSFSNATDNFQLGINLHKHTLFVVDEVSMISGSGFNGFASGNLLADLIRYVYSGEDCRLLLVGDAAQLPPVGESLSPALSVTELESYGLSVRESELTEVVRQRSGSGILWNATKLRNIIASATTSGLPKMVFNGWPDIHYLSGADLIEKLENCYHRDGIDQTIVITRTNKRAIIYNNGIRNRILGYEDELSGGEQLMVAKNNYFWADSAKTEAFDFIANGDVVFVRSNGNKALVGRSVVVYPNNIPTTFSGFCIRFRIHNSAILLSYLLGVLKTDSMRKKMTGRGANIQNLNQKILSELRIPIPELALQERFEQLIRNVDKTKTAIQLSLDKIEILKDTLMQKYFG